MSRALDISEITPYLLISSFPRRENIDQVRELGVRLILSMYLIRPDKRYGLPPLNLLWLPVFDTRVMPIPLVVFRVGVKAAQPVIEAGGKVLVHCRWGIHRSVAMACCILISQGYSLDESVALVKSRRAVADPEAAHILPRLKKFEQDWAARQKNGSR